VIVLYALLVATVHGASGEDAGVNVTEGIANLIPLRGRALFAFVTLIVIQATANAWVFAASRLFYAAGRNHLLPGVFAHLDGHGNPRNAILLVAAGLAVVLAVAMFFHVSVPDLVLISNQNFLVLYLVCIYASWKIGRGLQRWVVTPLALLSCGFLLAGFSYKILYPILLLAIGMMCQRSRDERPLANLAEDSLPPGV
jgi:amino acid transporter